MRTLVITDQDVIGFHQWTNAIDEVKFLSHKHRHIFRIRCAFEVGHDDREIEIFLKEDEIRRHLRRYGTPCHFFDMSCEMIAKEILEQFDAEWVEVFEDNRGGARVEK